MRNCLAKRTLTARSPAVAHEGALKHILLVDDDAEFLSCFADMLRLHDADYTISTAENGEQAAAIIRTLPIDLLITDLHMPVMGGLELVLRVAENRPDIPVIVMSASENPRAVRDLGTTICYFEKPVNVEDLLDAIHRLLLVGGGPRTDHWKE
jgi:DNA-binding NtrC family response regulator